MLLAVSGGADSMAMLHAVVLEKASSDRICVAHLNHGLRGEASDADQQLVEEYCEKLKVPCIVKKLSAADWRWDEEGRIIAMEATARTLRYEWLFAQAAQHQYETLLTAHHANDQAETLLHNLLRGTGFKGLRGIAGRKRVSEKLLLLRPLLSITRTEIQAYLEKHQIPYRVDASNNDTEYTRNFIRQHVMPLLYEVNSSTVEHLSRVSSIVRQFQRDTSRRAKRLLLRLEKPRSGSVVILDAKLGQVPLFLFVEVMQQLAKREGWPTGRLTQSHYKRLRSLFRGNLEHLNLPDGQEARRKFNIVQLTRK